MTDKPQNSEPPDDGEYLDPLTPDADDSPPQPICTQCATPFQTYQYYCAKCGAGVGQFTPYIPYVSIPFNYDPFRSVWRKLWYEPATFFTKFVCVLFIHFFAPIMWIGLPFVLWERWHRPTKPANSPTPPVGEAEPRDDPLA